MLSYLEFHEQSCIEAQACEVVGYCIAVVFGVGNPVVGVHILDAQGIECIKPQPYVAEVPLPSILYVTFLIVYQAIAHADVDTAVSRSTEDESLSTRMRGTERQAVGIYGTKVHLPAVRPGEIVGKAE